MTFQRIAVVGAGAWGTALANSAARAGRDVTLWARDAAMAAQLATTRENPRLPGIRLDDRDRADRRAGGVVLGQRERPAARRRRVVDVAQSVLDGHALLPKRP